MTIHIVTDKEIRVRFPQPVQIQMPLGITDKVSSFSPKAELVYWTAYQPFDKARVLVPSIDGQTMYIIDLIASGLGHAEDIYIEDPSLVLNDPLVPQSSINQSSAPLNDPPHIVLTRFAAQTLYAPERLIPRDPSMQLMAVTPIAKDFPLYRSKAGEQFDVEVVASWSGYGLYITAVKIQNTTLIATQLDFTRINGNFTHIAAQHLEVDEAGQYADRTTLYLISDSPFIDALMEDSYAY